MQMQLYIILLRVYSDKFYFILGLHSANNKFELPFTAAHFSSSLKKNSNIFHLDILEPKNFLVIRCCY